MRCLYCGKELALLKRLTGGGDFCSDGHKHSYQEEYNRLALSRLLQAQKKGQQTANPASQTPAQHGAPASVSVGVEEPVPDAAANAAPDAPVPAVLLREPEPAVLEPVEAGDSSAGAGVGLGAPVVEEPEPLATAGFLLESPTVAALAEETPYLEAWLDLSAGPAMSEWQLQTQAFGLTPADLAALDLPLTASSIREHAFSADLSPREFSAAQPDPPPSPVANKKVAPSKRLPACARIAIDIPFCSVAVDADRSLGVLAQSNGFQSTVLFDDSQLLELSPIGIDFPVEDSDVVVLSSDRYDSAPPDLVPGKAAVEAFAGDHTPRASLQALSRLHDELVEQETGRADTISTSVLSEEPAEDPAEAPVEAAGAVPEEPEAPKPRPATELLDVSIKLFPPAKPVPMGGDTLPTHVAPLLPHLKSLPLRPKVALAPGYVPPSKSRAPAESKSDALAPTPVHAQGPSKPAPGGKPAARLTQPKQPTPPAKARAAVAVTVVSPKVDAMKPAATPAGSQPTSVAAASAAQPDSSEAARNVSALEKKPASKPEPTEEREKPVADVTPIADATPKADTVKPAAEPSKPVAELVKKETVPSFGLAQPASASWLGSLKVKLGIAILLLVTACVYFLGWGGAKASKLTGPNPGVSSDGSGPSIILGEGGWVEDWGGDPSGMHAGRQITIYRPSLKLSDYRLEFQGSIDTKSIGWVFRAADPDNYYAMKLMTVSAGLSTKVALFKYLVTDGRQTQVGRVPIDLAVQADTIFNIRVDVRGPQFTTYIQGQQVDSWTDDQLKVGGAGFLNEREERGKVKSVSIRYLSGAAK